MNWVHTVTDWKNYLCGICAEYLIFNPVILDGPNSTVQIDESLFVRNKNEREEVWFENCGYLGVSTKLWYQPSLVFLFQLMHVMYKSSCLSYNTINHSRCNYSIRLVTVNTIGNIGYNPLTVEHLLGIYFLKIR